MTGVIDHLLVVVLMVGAPAWGAVAYRAFVREVREGKEGARLREYRATIILEWTFCLGLLIWWWWLGRDMSLLGLALPTGARSFAGLGLTLLVLAFLAYQWRAVTKLEGQALDPLRAQMAPVLEMLPHTDTEYRWFRGLAVTAGVCEEVLYRGFLIWYLAHWMPLWVAAIVGGAAFGLAHFYQGGAGVVKTGVTGVIAGLLFALTGSLLWPVILHAAVDLQGGAIARNVFLRTR
jgi:membrane protease YdiL (CAAX protease family)